jgi:hypothetical protein
MCSAPRAVAQNVVIVIADGLRREEVFGGAQSDLLPSTDEPTRTQFGLGEAKNRRRTLMPFLWNTIAAHGQLLGDPALGSTCEVTNRRNFSYPGYSETLCGYVDPSIRRNDSIPNPNVSVFEWLNRQPAFHSRVAAFGAWNVISAVFNKQRCQFVDVAGYEPVTGCKLTPALKALNHEKATAPRRWQCQAPDSVAFKSALEYTRANHPRVLFISLGETDKWSHEGKYDRYLCAAHSFDEDVSQLWTTLQAIPQYHAKTTLILTCDHGRGAGSEWTCHGSKLSNSRYTWMAFLGPGTSPLGDVPHQDATNGQIAATAAAALGRDYVLAQSKAAPPILSALR